MRLHFCALRKNFPYAAMADDVLSASREQARCAVMTGSSLMPACAVMAASVIGNWFLPVQVFQGAALSVFNVALNGYFHFSVNLQSL